MGQIIVDFKLLEKKFGVNLHEFYYGVHTLTSFMEVLFPDGPPKFKPRGNICQKGVE